MKKTTVMRILETAKIEYIAGEYEYDDNDISGLNVAKSLGFNPDMVFKTLVADGDKTGVIVLSVPVNKELDLKKVARESNNKKVTMIHVKDLLKIAGYIRGACSPIGMKKKFPTFVDKSIENVEKVSISAGQKGLQVILKTKDYTDFVNAKICDICE